MSENKPKIQEKSLNELLAETEVKITQKDYYQTEKFKLGNGIVAINFKPLSQKTFMKMNNKHVDERIPYLLSQTLYNPEEKRLYTIDELKALFDGLGGLTITIANKILVESGFDIKSSGIQLAF
ncbi:hypothetical protein [Methanobrevibacter arboriphilus]|uniref:Uncharacterized protein n=1 Tax=Methanobrevibacter arboriphilus TaxID=39441 RepID=A0ACA8R2I9_METAZ|nr:hypothetical protein [Methanobrevibacter arboriphilus]BBL61503.1 hypothetical protein MarbSA_05430 [Methanobrevibacter arboriphilus]